ncbi:hypothetical protein NLX83_25460 [Allokutzneria sp. A3M-2-11 16]|uniref:hypothetical protein n=1 Tax=Allokutzneria sp. A3M-2-11 16 TaxID=2962043 RepID=UPI0020B7E0F3|nr:hypothetical protein [Allokutzneria sp. A3M-2-11 16]MCP3802625.1 hypothetical protein [Allokutzneria sp. A3M-2-11 16]
MSRQLHFCGSLPPELTTTDAEVSRWFLDNADGRPITALPARQDPNWVIEYLLGLAAHRDVFEVTVPGEYVDYDDMRGYRVRKGAVLRPEHVSHGDVDETLSKVDAFTSLGLEGTRLMLPVPSPIDLALFTFVGPSFQNAIPALPEVRSALRYMPVYTDAIVDYVTRVTEARGEDVLWHIEFPSALIGMWKARIFPGGPALSSSLHTKYTAKMLARFPKQAKVILHLCYGNYNNTEIFVPKDLSWTVTYLNKLGRELTRRQVALPPVHIPIAFGAHAPSLDEAFYAPLKGLSPSWNKLIAGVVAESDELASVGALHLFESAARRKSVGVACACGLGRHTVAAAGRAAKAMITVAESHPRQD